MAQHHTSRTDLLEFLDASERMGWAGRHGVDLRDGSLLGGVPLARTSHGVVEISTRQSVCRLIRIRKSPPLAHSNSNLIPSFLDSVAFLCVLDGGLSAIHSL